MSQTRAPVLPTTAPWSERFSIGAKLALWAWAFLALPIVFYVVIRFWPTLHAFYLSLHGLEHRRPARLRRLRELSDAMA